MPNRKTSLRIAIAILLLWLLIPYIFGAGWALANFAYLGFYGSQHPETTEALRSMEGAEKESYAKSRPAVDRLIRAREVLSHLG